jgi:protein O-mannosyl-transferase
VQNEAGGGPSDLLPEVFVSKRRPIESSWATWLHLAFLAAVTLLAYYPAWHGGMLWDDDAHITRLDLRSLQGLWRIWFEPGATQQYYPLAHSAFWLQARLWGDQVLGYHLVNIGLHALSAFLVVVIMRRLALPGAVLAGVVFALHPVQVESVAWMTELKNTLSGALYLGALLAYLGFDRSRQRGSYALAMVLFVLALLSKTVTATLPAALLVVFWWQRGTVSWRHDVRPLAPFFLLGAAAGATTVWVERMFIGARGAEFGFPAAERILIAGRAFVFYLWQLLWPANLLFVYPRWDIDAGTWWQYLFPAAAAALLFAAWRLRARTRAPLAALLFFGITLAPALGFVNVYPFRFSFVADHFQYLASLGLIVSVAAALDGLLVRVKAPSPATVRGGLVLAVGVTLGVLTWQQSRLYADAGTLYRETLRRNPRAWLMHLNLGAMAGHGSDAALREAEAHFKAALAIRPDEAQLRNNLGTTWALMGRHADALEEHRAAVRLAPGYAEAYLNLGSDLGHLGRYEEAVEAYRTALDIKPGLATASYDLGVALLQLGRREEAISRVREALRLQPDYPEARRTLDDLVSETKEAALPGRGENENDTDALTHASLATTLASAGRLEEAVAEFERALESNPGEKRADVLNDLGVALARLGRMDEAISRFREAVRVRPGMEAARANLERALARSPAK